MLIYILVQVISVLQVMAVSIPSALAK